MDIEHGRIIKTPINVNETEYKGFSIPGVADIHEAWFRLGVMTNSIEYREMKAKPDGNWVMLSSSSDEQLEPGWIDVEDFSTIMGDY